MLRVDRLDDRPGATVRIAHLPGAAVSAAPPAETAVASAVAGSTHRTWSTSKKPALAAGPSGSHGKPQPCLNSTTNTCLDTNCTADTYPLHGQNSPVMHSKAVSLPASPSYSHARKAHAHFLHQQNP